jgi:hypothetical protein
MHKEYNHCGGLISKMLSYTDVPFMVSLSTKLSRDVPRIQAAVMTKGTICTYVR